MGMGGLATLTRAYLTLALTPGLGPRRIKLLTEHFGDAERVYQASLADLRQVEGIGPKLAEAIDQARNSTAPEAELRKAELLGVDILPLSHPDYPESLRQIYDPPPVLYVRGELPRQLAGPLERVRALAIVGTRNATPYGLELTRTLSRELAAAGVVIVSGLAIGIDTAAHEGALAASDGATVAVLGSGVDVLYPRQNQQLATRILAGRGAVVSEYPIGESPRAENFPGRNRIIAGLSRGVLMVEGGKKSGAMITADYAMEEGRTVFAAPGRIGDAGSEGTLTLLKSGAGLILGASDILAEFGWAAAGDGEAGPAAALNEAEQALVALIRRLDSPLLDDLMAQANLSAAELLPRLMMLELQGIVRSVPGGRYICLLPR